MVMKILLSGVVSVGLLIGFILKDLGVEYGDSLTRLCTRILLVWLFCAAVPVLMHLWRDD